MSSTGALLPEAASTGQELEILLGLLAEITPQPGRVEQTDQLHTLVETLQQAMNGYRQAGPAPGPIARLQPLTDALADATTPIQVAEVIIGQVLPSLDALGSSVYLLSDDDRDFEVVAALGYPPGLADRWQRFPAALATPHGDAARLGRPVLLPSREAAVAAYPYLDFSRPDSGNAWIILPLLVSGRAIGAMSLTFAEAHDFSPEEQEFMLFLAGQCALALERTRLHADLAQAHALLDTIFASAPVGLGFWDRELRFTRLNTALAEMNGLPVEAHLGKTPPEILPGLENIEQIEDTWRQVLATGQPVLNVEVSGETPARPGERRTWLESWYPVRVGKETIGLGGVAQDITDRKRMEEQLLVALAEKEILLKEVYHRVKNNLQAISNLLYLQSLYVPDGPARQAFLKTQDRIKSIALIHEKLHRSQDLNRLDFADYIRSLATSLIRSFSLDTGAIQLEVDFDDLPIDLEMVAPLGIIVNELLTNTQKHAFPPDLGRPAQVRIELRAVDAGSMCLTVGDNGAGLPDDFDLAAAESLGLQLVTTLTGHMQGAVELDRHGGTTFRITLPRLSTG